MKPRIKKFGLEWMCHGASAVGFGDNPRTAYQKWRVARDRVEVLMAKVLPWWKRGRSILERH